MSKKKGASRAAMTLKDFHGGSIPSDLPLPSAPGMTVDRTVYERQGSGTWMSPTLGRGFGNDRSAYHRQGSAGGVRTFEDKASYFPNPANIGRNYDEDERKPVESRPRSSHSADRFDEHAYEERRGGYSADRFTVEEQGSFSSGPNFSEPRTSSFSDRFPPSQVSDSGFERDKYVHDEFGLIPVGPLHSRLPFQDPQPLKQVVSHEREVSDARTEQLPNVSVQPLSNVPPYSSHHQIAISPPRSWRNPSLPVHSASVNSLISSDSATNVWTAKCDGDFNRPLSSGSDSIAPSPWRSQSIPGRALETKALDKVSSGRWQSDIPRPSAERRQQFVGSLPDPAGATEYQKSLATDHSSETRGSFPSDMPRYSPEASRGHSKSDPGRSLQSIELTQSAPDHGNRISVSNSKYSTERSQMVRGRTNYGVDTARQSYSDDDGRGNFSEADRYNSSSVDAVRTVNSDPAKGDFIDTRRGLHMDPGRGLTADDGRLDLLDQSRIGYRDASRTTFTPSGRVTLSDSARSVYAEHSMQPEVGEGLATIEAGQITHLENGRFPAGTETGRESSWSAAPGEQSEILERPKLKLLPRSKPLEKLESLNVGDDEFAGNDEIRINSHQNLGDKSTGEFLFVEAIVRTRPIVKEFVNSSDENEDESGRLAERPKLNLKPRSQPAEAESEEGSQKVRQSVFGGARPRELVLKDRGMDDVLNAVADAAQTPVTASAASATSPIVKWENNDIRVESRGDNKQDNNRRYERQERSFDRQGSHRQDRLDNSRGLKSTDSKWDLEKDSQWDQEKVDGRRKRDFDRQDSRRDADIRRDIDKQESWRRPAELSVASIGLRTPSSALSPLVDPSPRAASVRYSHSTTASAVELAHAFSRASSIGSAMTGTSRGTNSLQSPLSPIYKGSIQGFTPGCIGVANSNRDAPFSRLAEASMPPYISNTMEMHNPSAGFGSESQSFYGNVKLVGYESGEFKRGQSAQPDLSMGHHLNVENDNFPGKRGLPIRQNSGYYD